MNGEPTLSLRRSMISISKAAPFLFAAFFAQNVLAGSTGDAAPGANATVKTQDSIDIQRVMDSYHEAVVTHDGARLAGLFIPEGSAWLNVLSDDAYARAKAKVPDAKKIRVGSFKDFAELVSHAKANFDPRHAHVQINSDGTIASVYFDFIFLSDGRETNRGSEAWQLVKGTDGWKIAAITYSSNPTT
jgi:hypothetical protein